MCALLCSLASVGDGGIGGAIVSTWDLDLQGRTALALAAMEGHYDVVEYIRGKPNCTSVGWDNLHAALFADLAIHHYL